MTEITVPGIPDLPPPPATLQVRECARCRERGERYERTAAGDGTITEIREAIDALEVARRLGLPFGDLVTVGAGRHRMRVCPRCTNVGSREEPIPLFHRYPDRASRRKLRLR